MRIDMRIIIDDDDLQIKQLGRVLINMRLLLGDNYFYDIGQLSGVDKDSWQSLLEKAGWTDNLQKTLERLAERRNDAN